MDAIATGSGWQVIDGNINPRVGYEASDQDAASNPKYYGFLNVSGRFTILKQDTSAGTFRYYAGKSGYASAWASRASLAFDYLDTAYRKIAQ